MGATGWKASLLHKGRNITLRHWRMTRLAGKTGFQDDSPQPWSADGRTLVLITWDGEDPVCLYDLDSGIVTRLPTGTTFPQSVLWSPAQDRLLVVFDRRALVYDASGRLVSAAEWSTALSERVHAYWNRGDQFFVVTRESRQSKTNLIVYASETGKSIESHTLDPIDYLPYDHAAFRDVSRDGFTLSTRPGTWTVGRLLDTWADSQFMTEQRLLLLSTYRPTGSPRVVDGQLTCPAAIQWLEVEIE